MKYALIGSLCLGLVVSCVDANDRVEEAEVIAKHRPTAGEEAFASDVADAMIDRIVALLFREFAVTTPDNAAVGTEAISHIFDNRNDHMRLVGDVQPLQHSNRPRDDFERDALAAAKLGNNFSRTEKVRGTWYVRKSLAVSTAFSTSCVHCHANFENVSNPWVGALMVRARID
jgi:hypothetical protein